MKCRTLILAALLSLGSLPNAAAHHGRDFLVVQDYYLPGLLDGVLLGSFEMTRTGTDYDYGVEPEIIVGVLPRVALGVSVGFTDPTGRSWAYESVTPSIHIQITPPRSDFPIRLAVSASYEFAADQGAHGHGHGAVTGASPSGGGHSHSSTSSKYQSKPKSASYSKPKSGSGSTGGILKSALQPLSGAAGSAPAPPSGGEMTALPAPLPPQDASVPASTPDLGPDAPPDGTPVHDHSSHSHGGSGHSHSGSKHSHSGSDKGGGAHSHGSNHSHGNEPAGGPGEHHGSGSIHSHGQDAFIGRLIMEADLTGKDKLVFNLINVLPDEGEVAWGYAAGLRHNLTHSFSVSVEGIGDFSTEGYHELNVGAFLVPDHHITLRAGVGFGLTESSPDLAIRGGVVWRF
jgi:hypothetical protein